MDPSMQSDECTAHEREEEGDSPGNGEEAYNDAQNDDKGNDGSQHLSEVEGCSAAILAS